MKFFKCIYVSEDCLFTFNNCEENSIAGFVTNIVHTQCCVEKL